MAATPMFQFGASGCPEHVWSVLTSPEATPGFLFGVSLESTWALGSPITGWLDGTPVLSGEVLFSAPPCRLSYVLASGAEQPEVYATWEVLGCDGGSVVQLSVFEPDTEDNAEVEALWQPVVTGLQSLLSRRPL
jgi:hypothetical protein